MTLLETLLAMSLLSMIALLGAQTVRMSWQVWDVQDRRSSTLQHLDGVLTHITRLVRSAREVVGVSGPNDTSGNLEITLPDDSVVKWYYDNSDSTVRYEVGGHSPGDLLATGIDSLKFECFQIDGVTPTTVVDDVRMIRVTTSVTVPVQGTSFPLSTTIWIRKQRDGVAAKSVDFYPSHHSGGASWDDKNDLWGPPDGLYSYGNEGARVEVSECNTSGYADSDPVGTVLIGIYLKTDGPLGKDMFEVQLKEPSSGLVHSFGESALLRFENNPDWFWVDLTDDLSSWTYADIRDGLEVKIRNRDEGVGGTTIRVDSVKIRTFEAAPQSTSFWMIAAGSRFNEWGNRNLATGAPDGAYAYSTVFTLPSDDVDRQDYLFTGSWQDLGAIISAKMRIHYYMSATVIDDMFHARLLSPTAPLEGTSGTEPAPNTAQQVATTILNQHVGVANVGTVSLDFSNIQSTWTWPELNAQIVRLYMTASGLPEAEIYVDAVSIEVRYVPPTEAAVVLWEEL